MWPNEEASMASCKADYEYWVGFCTACGTTSTDYSNCCNITNPRRNSYLSKFNFNNSNNIPANRIMTI
jgi:hypothetical protein